MKGQALRSICAYIYYICINHPHPQKRMRMIGYTYKDRTKQTQNSLHVSHKSIWRHYFHILANKFAFSGFFPSP